MPVTFTIDPAYRAEKHWLSHKHRSSFGPTIPAAGIMRVVMLDFAGTYDPGGFLITPNLLGMGKIIEMFYQMPVSTPPGYIIPSTPTSAVIFEANGLGTVAEKAGGSPMAAYINVMCTIFGY